jgi:hypothetical protein
VAITSITVIRSLVAAFSTSAIKTFDTRRAIVFFAAIFLTGVSLFLTVFLRAVEPRNANYQSLDDMLDKNDRALRLNRGWRAGPARPLPSPFSPRVLLPLRPLSIAILHQLHRIHSSIPTVKKASQLGPVSFNGPRTLSEMKLSAQGDSSRNNNRYVVVRARILGNRSPR